MYYGVTPEMKDKVLDVFTKYDSINLNELIVETKMSLFILLTTMYDLITNDTSITKNKKRCYIREQNNVYYITDVHTNKVSLLDLYYKDAKQPEVVLEKTEVPKQYVFSLNDLFGSDKIKNTIQLKQYLKSVNTGINEEQKILEHFITNKGDDVSGVWFVVGEFFSGLFGEINGVTYTWYKLSEIVPRKKIVNAWVDCSEDEIKNVKRYTQMINIKYIKKYNDIQSTETKTNSFVGMFDYDQDGKRVFKLLIVNQQNMEMLMKSVTTDEKIDRRKLTSGVVCTFIPAKKVLSHALELQKVTGYKDYTTSKKTASRPELCQYIEEILRSKNIYTRFIEK